MYHHHGSLDQGAPLRQAIGLTLTLTLTRTLTLTLTLTKVHLSCKQSAPEVPRTAAYP